MSPRYNPDDTWGTPVAGKQLVNVPTSGSSLGRTDGKICAGQQVVESNYDYFKDDDDSTASSSKQFTHLIKSVAALSF